MFSVGFSELILILVVALIVLGPQKLPEAGAAIGRALREFKENASTTKVIPENKPEDGPISKTDAS